MSIKGSETEIITGTIHLLGKNIDLLKLETMTLFLKDGRQWNFMATSGNFITGIYQVINASDKGLIPKPTIK